MSLLERCLVCACGVDNSVFFDGKQALAAGDGGAVEAARGWRFVKSINLDKALSKRFPNDSRWDYGLELKAPSGKVQIDWVEVHPASSSEVETMIKKKEWLVALLSRAKSCPLPGSGNLHWLATRGVQIDAQRRRRLAAAGLRMPTKSLRLPISNDRD
jgi:hypothetical protein